MQHKTMIPAIADDGSLFPMEKLLVHEKAQLHLAVSIFVFDGSKILLQRRARGKYHCGGQWSNTCCTHPNWNESLSASAHRRLNEELGFSIPLKRKCEMEYSSEISQGLYECERVTLFVGQVSRQFLEIRPNPDEVEEVRWMTPHEIYSMIDERPDKFTPWFCIYTKRFPGLMILNGRCHLSGEHPL